MGLTYFFLFLDERNNRVRVTNCQPPLSPTQFLDLCRCDSLATARQAMGMEGQISIFRARDLKSWRRAPSVRKTFEKLITDFLFSVPCYPAKYVFIVIFIWHFIVSLIMLFLACNFFSAEKIESRTSIRAFFSNPISQSSSVFIGGTVTIWMQFHVGYVEIPPDHVRLVFATFLVNLKFTSKLNGCILKTIYIEQITSLWSDSLVISAYWLVLEQILSTSFSHFVLN